MDDYSEDRTIILNNTEKEFILEYDEKADVILKLRVYKETKDGYEYSAWSNLIEGNVE
jgi:hypothetical protein